MPLTSKQLTKAERWINKHLPDKTCAVCRKGIGMVWQNLITAPSLCGDERDTVPQQVAFLVLRCDTCGHSLLFDARQAGVVTG